MPWVSGRRFLLFQLLWVPLLALAGFSMARLDGTVDMTATTPKPKKCLHVHTVQEVTKFKPKENVEAVK